jgi:4'-phosphopantetheinyl transferase EntD
MKPTSAAHLASALRQILPERISVAAIGMDDIDMTAVPSELILDGAAVKRQRQFVAGRLAARQAIEACGHESAYPARGEDRQPLWPEGLVGSISHTDRYALAAAASANSTMSVGVDLEALRHMESALRQKLLTESETSRLQAEGRYDDENVLTLFSLKESGYKAVYPYFGRYIGLREVEISPTEEGVRFKCIDPDHPAAGLVARLRGDALRDGDHVVAGCWIAG